MFPPYKPSVSKGTSEIMDLLGMVMLASPSSSTRRSSFRVGTRRRSPILLMRASVDLDEIGRGAISQAHRNVGPHARALRARPCEQDRRHAQGRDIIHEMEVLLKQGARKP